jgi:uncharacterized coiled-coil DUF342 family protein
MEKKVQTLMFTRKEIGKTVQELRQRYENLADALEWTKSSDEAHPLQAEMRMISATLDGVDREYGAGYFKENPSGVIVEGN